MYPKLSLLLNKIKAVAKYGNSLDINKIPDSILNLLSAKAFTDMSKTNAKNILERQLKLSPTQTSRLISKVYGNKCLNR